MDLNKAILKAYTCLFFTFGCDLSRKIAIISDWCTSWWPNLHVKISCCSTAISPQLERQPRFIKHVFIRHFCSIQCGLMLIHWGLSSFRRQFLNGKRIALPFWFQLHFTLFHNGSHFFQKCSSDINYVFMVVSMVQQIYCRRQKKTT